LQKDYSVYFKGPEHSFSHKATVDIFKSKPNTSLLPVEHFKSVFKFVLNDKNAFGVIPIENSLAGSVQENYDYLNLFKTKIIAEYYLNIELSLLTYSTAKARISDFDKLIPTITHVHSHPKALEQCSDFFDKYPTIQLVACTSTTAAAQRVAQLQNPSFAALASSDSAQNFGLQVLKKNLENLQPNFTRFFVLSLDNSTEIEFPENTDNKKKFSLVVELPHVSGALSQLLNKFVDLNCNLTKIESRPIPESPFSYRFFIDLVAEDFYLKKIQDFVYNTNGIRVLGEYTAAN
jgi:prephenate dehydratase